MPTVPSDRVYIGELAEILERKPDTIRGWERTGRLPTDLCSQRGQDVDGYLGWRYWTSDQVEGIKQWLAKQPLSGFRTAA